MASIMERSRAIVILPLRLLRTPVTVVQGVRRVMKEPSTVGEARRAFVEEMAGRVKAVTGFVLGDDRLLTTGQIERAKAARRLGAMADEAAAETTGREAGDRFARQVERSTRAKDRVTKERTRKTARIESQTKNEKARAEADADRGRRAAHRGAMTDEQVVDVTDVAIGAEAIEQARRESAPEREA